MEHFTWQTYINEEFKHRLQLVNTVQTENDVYCPSQMILYISEQDFTRADQIGILHETKN